MVKIFVGNCSEGSTSDDLRSYFSRYGRVLEADVLEGKGFGFVHMESQSDANAAVAALDGADFKGRKLRVEISTGRRGGGDAGGSQRGNRNDRGYGGGGGGGDRYGGGGRSGGGGGGRGPPRGGGGRGGGGGGRSYDRGRNNRDDSYGRGSGGGGGRRGDYYDDAPSSRNSYGGGSRGGGGRYDDSYGRGGDGDYDRAPPSKYRDPSPPSYGSRDRYESRGSSGQAGAPAERYRSSYDTYERRQSPPPSSAYYGRSGGRSPSPPGRGRSPLARVPAAYGTAALAGAGSAGRFEAADLYDPRRSAPMARGRSPPPQPRGGLPPPTIRQIM